MKKRKEINELILELIYELYKIKNLNENEQKYLYTYSRDIIVEIDGVIKYVSQYLNRIEDEENSLLKDDIIKIKNFIKMNIPGFYIIGEPNRIKNFDINIKKLCELIYDAFLSVSTNNNSKIIDNKITELQEKLKTLELKDKNNENLLESERLEKDKLIKELEFKNKQFQEQLEKENELFKINEAIKKLNVPCTELEDTQNKLKENRDNFHKYAMNMFKISTVIFVIMTLYLFLFTEINDVTKSISLGYYLSHSFPILFPTIIGFLFIRQSNISIKELEKVNRRLILMHEVNQSLKALAEINDEKQMNEKTQKVIDKLIENILNYASESCNTNNNQEINIFGLNERIDKIIDTFDKKLTVIGKTDNSN
ncbi:hypothetical protein PJV95_08630 [Aliarcobacter butzleri]|uniref:hypothetical protein n=1 Tax=Aliarcobacter butzleri TaxID=28197 RepID=UPI00263E983D|nr:hypothetical protein [Aliarcobacter butzleri]MDN5126303.1 hypothetical protein [Aliarcobacter butzleri]